jgi:hypothetical protein
MRRITHSKTWCATLAATGFILVGAGSFWFTPFARAGKAFPLQCTASDLDAWIRIERHGEASDLEPALVGKALVQLLEARHICGQHRISEALILYEGVLPGPIRASAAK